MKKKHLKSLQFNKHFVSSLNTSEVKGGTGSLLTDAIGCTIAFTDNCSSGDPRKRCQPCH